MGPKQGSGVRRRLASLNALAQAAAEPEGSTGSKHGQGAGDGIANFHIDCFAGAVMVQVPRSPEVGVSPIFARVVPLNMALLMMGVPKI